MSSFVMFEIFFVGIMYISTVQLVAYTVADHVVTTVMEKRYSNKLKSRTNSGKYCVILQPTNSQYPVRYYSDNLDEIMNLYSDLYVHYPNDAVVLKK